MVALINHEAIISICISELRPKLIRKKFAVPFSRRLVWLCCLLKVLELNTWSACYSFLKGGLLALNRHFVWNFNLLEKRKKLYSFDLFQQRKSGVSPGPSHSNCTPLAQGSKHVLCWDTRDCMCVLSILLRVCPKHYNKNRKHTTKLRFIPCCLITKKMCSN